MTTAANSGCHRHAYPSEAVGSKYWHNCRQGHGIGSSPACQHAHRKNIVVNVVVSIMLHALMVHFGAAWSGASSMRFLDLDLCRVVEAQNGHDYRGARIPRQLLKFDMAILLCPNFLYRIHLIMSTADAVKTIPSLGKKM
jgi:hypothetical protein